MVFNDNIDDCILYLPSQVLQFGVAEEVEVRDAPRRWHPGQKAAVRRCRGGGRILLRPAPERVVPVHRSFRSVGPDGSWQTADQLWSVAAGPGGQGPWLPSSQFGAGHADGGRLSGDDSRVITVRHGRCQRTVDQVGRLLQGRCHNVRVTHVTPASAQEWDGGRRVRPFALPDSWHDDGTEVAKVIVVRAEDDAL